MLRCKVVPQKVQIKNFAIIIDFCNPVTEHSRQYRDVFALKLTPWRFSALVGDQKSLDGFKVLIVCVTYCVSNSNESELEVSCVWEKISATQYSKTKQTYSPPNPDYSLLNLCFAVRVCQCQPYIRQYTCWTCRTWTCTRRYSNVLCTLFTGTGTAASSAANS